MITRGLLALGKVGDCNMSVQGLVIVVIGVVAFVIIDSFITHSVTGTDTGSVILQNLLRVIIAAGILIGVVGSIRGERR